MWLRKWIDKIKRRRYLKYYYKARKRGYVADIQFDDIPMTLRYRDIDNYELRVSVNGTYKLEVLLVGLSKEGVMNSRGVQFMVMRDLKHKPINNCTWREFKKYYGQVILFLYDNSDVINSREMEVVSF